MKRQARADYSQPNYPDLQALADRRSVLKGLFGLGAIAVVPVASGCLFPVSGDIVVPNENTAVRMPPEPESHTLYFPSGGFVDYHIEAVVRDWNLAEFLDANCDDLLAALNDLFLEAGVYTFAPDADLTEITHQVTVLLAEQFTGENEAPTGAFVSLTIVVHAYDEGEELSGDIEAPE